MKKTKKHVQTLWGLFSHGILLAVGLTKEVAKNNAASNSSLGYLDAYEEINKMLEKDILALRRITISWKE
jgi:hypothetical protein